MKKRWKRWKGTLTYRVRLGINLLLIAACAFGLWAYSGCPLPTTQMEVERLVRQRMLGLEEVEILAEMDSYSSERRQVVALGEGYGLSAEVGGGVRKMLYWPLEEQEGAIKLIPTIGYFRNWWAEDEALSMAYHSSCGVVIPELPEGAARAVMVMEDDVVYEEEGVRLDSGAWLFAFTPFSEGYFHEWLYGKPYELTVYGGGGAVLARQAGELPDDPR